MDVVVISAIVVVAIIVLLIGVLSTWRKVPQDKALVVTGLKKRVISGGGGLVIPVLERADMISLENMSIDVKVIGSLCTTGVPLDVSGTIIVKIRQAETSIYSAMEQFNTGKLDTTIGNIKKTVQEVMEGKLREICSTLEVEDVFKNREMITSKVSEIAVEDLSSMGLEIKTFTIRDISDQNGYLQSLGVKQTEEVKRQAAIAKAEAARDVAIKRAAADRAAKEEELKAATLVAAAEKDNVLKVNEYRQEQETAKAKADAAYSIEQNIRNKEVTEAQMQVEIKRKQMEIDLAHQETLRKTEQLKAEIEKTAEAQKYKAIQEAEAEKARQIAQAQAEAEQIRLKADAEAKSIELRGRAEAEAIRLKGQAEADAMREKAEAYKQYGEAAILELMVEKLPEIAHAISAPLAQTEKIVIMDQGGENGGASKIPGYINTIAGMVPEAVEALTGKNMMDIVEKALTKTNSINTNVNVADTDVQDATIVEN
ncbi:MAG TPA: flotillin [Firmicutes bacterium]|nr:flotillin [Bacillota bacterium]